MSRLSRRKLLIERMNELESQGKSCVGCMGTCCTFEANSMMVTPLEAVELIFYLKQSNLWNEVLKEMCLETITKFRLDHPAGNGRRSYLRRTYTCPFFNHGELGCPLPREVKPFGCLAFNSHHAELKAGAECFSEQELLSKREIENSEEAEINERIRIKMNLFWKKTPLPLALIELWDKTIDADLISG